jgi:hypothetical protein
MIPPKQYLTSIETNAQIEVEHNKTTTTALNIEQSLISDSHKTECEQLNTNLCTKRNIKIHLLNKYTSIYITNNYGEKTGKKAQTDIENIAATIIQRFFKKVLAASSYRYMFSNGQVFQKASTTTNKYKHFAKYHSNANNKNFSSLESMQEFSTLCLQEIKDKLGLLTAKEQRFINRITHFPEMIFMHRSFDNLLKKNTKGKKQATIYSNKTLQEKKIKVLNTYTKSADKKQLANNDFVFCTPYFNFNHLYTTEDTINDIADSTIIALTCHYGTNAYFFNEEQFPYFYFTLTDHFFSKVFVYNRLPSLSKDYKYIERSIIGAETIKKYTYVPIFTYNDVPMFTQKDMRLAIAYYTIDFLRSLDDSKEHNTIRNRILITSDPEDFNYLFHAIFNPEIHIPKILVLDNPREFSNYRHNLFYLNSYAPSFVSEDLQPHYI